MIVIDETFENNNRCDDQQVMSCDSENALFNAIDERQHTGE